MSKTIKTAKGESILVDDEDYEYLTQWKWHIRSNYAVRSVKGRKRGMVYDILHREVQKGVVIDHINHNRLDNRKCNLRIVTHSGNSQNKSKHGKSSKYLGVYKNTSGKGSKCWKATITKSFKTEEEAAKFYDKAASFLFGEYANLNFS